MAPARRRSAHAQGANRATWGDPGIRDAALLESALNRPRHDFMLAPGVTLPALAAILAFGLSRNHPFIDGNKRVSLVASFTFLKINGHHIDADLDETFSTFLGVADGTLNEDELIAWFTSHAKPD